MLCPSVKFQQKSSPQGSPKAPRNAHFPPVAEYAQYPQFSWVGPLGHFSVILSGNAAIPTVYHAQTSRVFMDLWLARGVLLGDSDEVARNGALSRINFGQRFSWAPLAFSSNAERSPFVLIAMSYSTFLSNLALPLAGGWQCWALSAGRHRTPL
jgi:hypothetical protein